MIRLSTVTSKGQTTIPREVRDGLGLKPGDRMFYFPDGRGGFRLGREKSVDEVAGCLADDYDGPAKSIAEMEQDIARDLHREFAPSRPDKAAE